MPKGIFRFYEELNDFLPGHRKKTDFEAEFNGKRSIKDIIEEIGVPHTEVDLVLINGKPADYNYIFQDGDRASVYPVFESFNIKNVTLLRRIPLRRIQFIADIHLKDMVKPMRMLGFDIDFNPSYTTQDIIRISEQENRIILTTRKGLITSTSVTHGMLIHSGTSMEQIKYVIASLDLKDRIKPFSRCLRCNSLLDSEFTGKSLNRITSETKSVREGDILCKSCDENAEL